MRGFSLIEVLVVLGILSSLFGMGMVASMSGFFRNQVHDDYQTLYTALLQARAATLSSTCTLPCTTHAHGIYIDANTITLFQGETYTGRTTSEDSVFPRRSTVTVTGSTEVVFTNGAKTTPQTITFSKHSGKNFSLAITKDGAIFPTP